MANQYPCRTNLTDNEFLHHMIQHHQMAINISRQHDKYSHNDIIKTIIRDLIRTQTYEIFLMQTQLKKKIDNISIIQNHNPVIYTTISNSFPNTVKLTNTYCDPQFFNPNMNMHMHAGHNVSTDKMYIDHMIPHHQVAIDMCKLIMKNTKNDFIMSLAYEMLKTQEAEVFLLNNLRLSNTVPNQLYYC
jgi:uncharacterized protein (DUF305 family)